MFKKFVAVIIVIASVLSFSSYAEGSFSSNPDAIEQAAKSVLMLEVFNASNEMVATGSGFVAFNTRALVTNYHVIEGADWMMANSDDGYQYMVTKVLIADEEKDIAICEFMSPTDLIPLEFNKEGELRRAENVVAIGNPLGVELGMTNTVSIGNIGALYEDSVERWIQFTAPISSGSSGGALFDDNGKVIGMTSATFTDGQNMNLAIHISEVQDLYEKWDGVKTSIPEYFSEKEEKITAQPIIPQKTPDPTLPSNTYGKLKMGDSGDAVKKLQTKLAELGFYTGSVNGIFDEITESAVYIFFVQNYGYGGRIATNSMQQLLFDGNPKKFKNPDFTLYFKENAAVKWEYTSDNHIKICFQVSNSSQYKTVQAFELFVFAVDSNGEQVYDEKLYSGLTTKPIFPNATSYSDYIILPQGNDISIIFCGIHKVSYTDGTVCTTSEDSIEYTCWQIK